MVTPPTCTKKGYITYTCTCGESYSENNIIAGLVDTAVLNVHEGPGAHYSTVAALEKGVQVIIYEQKTVDGISWLRIEQGWVAMAYIRLQDGSGHSYGDWYETKAPTQEEEGEEQRDCLNCDYFEIHIKDKLVADKVTEGICGDNLTWTIEDNKLVIAGSGDMYDYIWYDVPWVESVSSIISVEFQGEITSIGNNAFNGITNITNINFPTTLTRIGDFAFDGCSGITKVDIPINVEYIGEFSFRGLGITEITIPEKVTSIGDRVFAECSALKKVNFYAINAEVGNQVFPDSCQNSKDISLFVGKNVKKIPDNLFSSNSSCTSNLKEIIFEEGCQCTEIGDAAFADSIKLESVELPSNLVTIDSGAFSSCGLQEIMLPDTVTTIGNNAFSNSDKLRKINIPKNVVSIGNNAFAWCYALEEIDFDATNMNDLPYGNEVFYHAGDQGKGICITIGCNVTKIPAYLFASNIPNPNKLKSVIFEEESVCEIIGHHAFQMCEELSEIVIPGTVTDVGSFAFDGCKSLKTIRIPENVTSIGRYAFADCTGLTEIGFYPTEVMDEAYNYDGIFYSAGIDCDGVTVTIGSNVKRIPGYTFSGDSATYNIPKIKAVIFEDGSVCEEIGYGTFRYCTALDRITIPNSVESIGSNAFFGCTNLSSVIIPESVTKMGSNTLGECPKLLNAGPLGGNYNIQFGWNKVIPAYSFYGCSSIESVIIPEETVQIGMGAFQNCVSLTLVHIPGSVEKIGDNCFVGCENLKTVGPLGSSCNIEFGWKETIIPGAFKNCNAIEEITIPESIGTIGKSAFGNCTKLTKINYNAISIPDNPNSDYSAFSGAGVDSAGITIVVGPNVTRIPGSAFNNRIIAIDFGSNRVCTEIGDEAFAGCNSLTTVTIPESIVRIGAAVFQGCSNLSQINYNAIDACVGNTFSSSPFYYAGSMDSTLIIGKQVKQIPSRLCYNSNIFRVVFEENSMCQNIGSSAFSACRNLTKIIIPQTVTQIGNHVFQGAFNLTSAGPIGEDYSIEFMWTDEILKNAFEESSISEIVIPETISVIGENAFSNCSQLTSITIPRNVKTIGNNAFKNCRRLQEILFYPTMMNDLDVDSEVFHCTDGFISESVVLTIGSNVTRIPANLFGTADSDIRPGSYRGHGVEITDIRFEKNSTCLSIGTQAFYRCDKLKTIEIPSSIRTIGRNAFKKCYEVSDTYYGSTEEEWKAIDIESGNTSLTNATIHYNSIGPNNGDIGDEDNDDDANAIERIYLFSRWDSANQIVHLDDGSELSFVSLGYRVTEETDKSFLANVSSLVGTYVLAKTKTHANGSISTLLRIIPLETKTGTVTALDGTTITIDGTTYALPETLKDVDVKVGDSVMYHLYNSDLVGINGKGSADDDNDDSAENIGTVRYYSGWEPESKTVTFGRDIMSMATVPENADPSLLNALKSLQGNYVLAEIKEQDGVDELVSILPVESIAAKVEYVSSILAKITIGGTEYPVSSGDLVSNVRVDNYVLCHIYDRKVIAVEILQELTGKLMGWNKNTREVSIALANESDLGALGYSLSNLAGVESVEFLSKLSSDSTTIVTDIQFICDEQGFVYRLENYTDNTAPSDMKTVAIKYMDDLEKQEKTAQVNWGYPLFREDARNIEESDPTSFTELVKISALLSKTTYDLSDGGHLQQALNQLGAENIEIVGGKIYDLANPAHSISHVKFNQGGGQKSVIIVTVRGTKSTADLLTDIYAWAFDSTGSHKEHLGFSAAKTGIKNEVTAYLEKNGIEPSNSKILITGHSYGAAVANLLAKSLEGVFDQSDIFAYTYASPNTIVVDYSSVVLGRNIHNFRNVWDPVVRIPVALLPTETYTVFGQQHFFTLEEIEDDSEGIDVFGNHNCTHYVNYALDLVEHNSIDSLETRCVQVHCPVDVTAYDENGKVVGRITDNQLDESSTTIMMYLVSDQKNIFIDQNDEVQLSIVATDSGTMDVIITDYDVVTGKVLVVKEYSDIGLKESKAFQTSITDEIATRDIELEVVDRKGYRLAIVNENGSEMVDISEEHEHSTEMQNVKEATCTETGYSGDEVCSECGTVVKQGAELKITSHDYETTWSLGDANGHWHKCKNCTSHDTQVKHTPGAAATETTPQTCTVCSYVITPALGHTCTAGTKWYSNGTYHWHLCTSCSAWVGTRQHVYSSSTDASCNTCGYTRAIQNATTAPDSTTPEPTMATTPLETVSSETSQVAEPTEIETLPAPTKEEVTAISSGSNGILLIVLSITAVGSLAALVLIFFNKKKCKGK